ncbi:MAG: TonB-dependent receptor [Burkholderiales bacterium]|nr:TonB-dependent receptor [Burkholderiales bacterium]
MEAPRTLRRTRLAITIALAFPIPAFAQQNPAAQLEAPTVEVVGTTPVPGIGTPRDQIPSNVQSVTAAEITDQQSSNIPDLLNRNLGSVNVNDTQGNPFQPEVNYRGFNASHLLGIPQGLSVYQDGVRVNEPFGDIVNWDLIPQSAISTINLIPGSNPLFGLNTLGGALSIRTKSGKSYPGTLAEIYGGSFDRRAVSVEHGGERGPFDYFVTGNWFKEDGWRDFSGSDVKQLFAKGGYETANSDLDFSVTHADTDLIGNELVPLALFNQRNQNVYTLPDQTQNRMTLLNLTGSRFLTQNLLVAGNVYYRRSDRDGNNGDTNDDFEDSPNDAACDPADFADPADAATCAAANAGGGINADTAATNRTRTRQDGSGYTLQLSDVRETNQATVGTTFDRSRSSFEQFTQEGVFSDVRSVIPTDDEVIENNLIGRTRTFSLFATDTYALTPQTHVTASGRYNHTRVENRDQLSSTPPNLDGDFTFNKFNPALGLTHAFVPALTVYGGYSQGNRAPSPVELGCADPANPCTLPNALASDPPLEQVVARTLEAGLRGNPRRDINWNLGVFRTKNSDDIIFISTSAAAGFFTNFGETQREGIEAGLNGRSGRFSWNADYSYIRATFQSPACLLGENNSSRGTSAACASDDEIAVAPGDSIPGIPRHSVKLATDYAVTDTWSVGADVRAFSSQFVRGNENNTHQAGTFTDQFGETRTFLNSGEASGFAVVNLTTRYRIARDWEIFARIDNLFDREYFNGGALGENTFSAAGAFLTNSEDWTRETFYAPGAPRAGWIGIRYTIDRK